MGRCCLRNCIGNEADDDDHFYCSSDDENEDEDFVPSGGEDGAQDETDVSDKEYEFVENLVLSTRKDLIRVPDNAWKSKDGTIEYRREPFDSPQNSFLRQIFVGMVVNFLFLCCKDDSPSRIARDKLAAISDVYNRWSKVLKRVQKAGTLVTIDE